MKYTYKVMAYPASADLYFHKYDPGPVDKEELAAFDTYKKAVSLATQQPRKRVPTIYIFLGEERVGWHTYFVTKEPAFINREQRKNWYNQGEPT